jgi:hypothetical protein
MPNSVVISISLDYNQLAKCLNCKAFGDFKPRSISFQLKLKLSPAAAKKLMNRLSADAQKSSRFALVSFCQLYCS